MARIKRLLKNKKPRYKSINAYFKQKNRPFFAGGFHISDNVRFFIIGRFYNMRFYKLSQRRLKIVERR